jgi:hypothetical protein
MSLDSSRVPRPEHFYRELLFRDARWSYEPPPAPDTAAAAAAAPLASGRGGRVMLRDATLCRNWSKSGSCPRSTSCSFVHAGAAAGQVDAGGMLSRWPHVAEHAPRAQQMGAVGRSEQADGGAL